VNNSYYHLPFRGGSLVLLLVNQGCVISIWINFFLSVSRALVNHELLFFNYIVVQCEE